ncbi:unnamed protein product [Penicillium salamii]|uniref:ER-bound oxygenase mpaB/mpaB'/Rubber oxygenase catalytic domain-containing protein n=1 Tax=Penicillium salamii TaxID=1612424 RepID=A0A9W4IQ67_9EURO|nr:unnamed protein product [Penicillium salamii]CAG8069198.1 unnamed protein product [Penicillium salamii]CAG8265037.1 unnamed protein product [Penicillium salamii]CAG8317615.1 unnamed protein product [Penicillium salamii]CAG8325309.1 unnamed protein product [Penicillium salamii]
MASVVTMKDFEQYDSRNFLAQTSLQQRVICVILALATYLFAVQILRFKRRQALQERYSCYATRRSMGNMTDQDAWAIQKTIMQTEFPFIVLKSLQFALFRTYGIPTISTLLLKTSQFSDPSTSFKRYADTGILIGEFMAFDPRSERAQTAIARTKYLHQGYRASGKILEADMLYTLSLFAIEPIRFVKLFEWREMTEMERCAVGTYWKSLGDALGISFDALPSGKIGFQDGLHWLEEIGAWSHAYEVQHMKPHPRNKEIAERTIDVLLYSLPDMLKPLGMNLVSYLMDERLRSAMMIDPPTVMYSGIFASAFNLRQLSLRHLSLPRPNYMRLDVFAQEPNKYGRNWVTIYEGEPYYVEPSIYNRWCPTAWLIWALGRPIPGDEGDKYCPRGYFTPDLGPKYFEGKGHKELKDFKESLRQQRQGQCPFP